MALEIMDGRLLHDQSIAEQDVTLDNFNPDVFESPSAIPPQPQHVIYDCLHDAESLSWVHLWILLMRMPHPASQMLGNDIFQNLGIASPSRRKLFLSGIRQPEVDKVHPSVQNLATLWNFPRSSLLKGFTSPDRTNSMYAAVYGSLYVLCSRSSEMIGVPCLASVRPLGHLAAPPSMTQSHSQGPADDEDYVLPNDRGGSMESGVEKMQLGKRKRQEDTGSAVYVLVPTAPMKRGSFI